MTVREELAAATRLYDAFADDDADAMRAALAPTFRGVVSAGMPFGVGGTYESPDDMLATAWIGLSEHVDVAPVPDEYLDVGDGRVVVIGRYRGRALAGGAEIDAAFVHLLRVDGGLITELVQVTDTAQWHSALACP